MKRVLVPLAAVAEQEFDLIALPGRAVAAICAAPMVLASAGPASRAAIESGLQRERAGAR